MAKRKVDHQFPILSAPQTRRDTWGDHVVSGHRLLVMHQWDRALAEFETADRMHGDDEACLLGQAECHLRLLNYEAVRSCCDRLLRHDPGCAKAHRILGCVAEETGDKSLAFSHYDRALRCGDLISAHLMERTR